MARFQSRDLDQNNRFFVLAVGASAVAGTLALPSVILPWVWTALDLPLLLVGLTIPLLQGGRLLSPLFLLRWVARLRRRKWLVVISSGTLAFSLMALSLLAQLSISTEIVIILLLAIAFLIGVGRGAGRFGYKEVIARTLEKNKRGTLTSRAASVGGWVALGGALFFNWLELHKGQDATEMLHILSGAGLWCIAACSYALLFEEAYTVPERPRMRTLLSKGREALRQEKRLRQFTVLRMLLLSLDLAYPFYIVHAAATHGKNGISLSLIIIFTSLASILQVPVWGKRLDRSPQRSLTQAASLAALAGVLLLGVEVFSWMQSPLVHGVALLLVGIAVQGGLNARNLYMVQITTEENRPVITTFTTTLSGIFGLVLAGVLGSVAHYQNVVWVIIALVLLQLSAAGYGRRGAQNSEG